MLSLFLALLAAPPAPALPKVAGDWWTIAGSPDLGPITTPRQQPVDFAVWPAADGTWQLLSCVRGTREPGRGRVLHRWEGKALTDPDWTPKGVAMKADPALGETAGGLQAPFVVRAGDRFTLFYGDWENICSASGTDGKAFERLLGPSGKPALFAEAPPTAEANTRDAMLLRVGDEWHCYYTAHPGKKGAVYCRRSADLKAWGPSVVVAAGGAAGTGPSSAECPFVVRRPDGYYLFRTQIYGAKAITRVYRSADPLDFGRDDDRCLVGSLPVAAPEIVEHEGKWYIAALRPDLKGIQMARLEW